jgi:hypothetical protein
MNLLREPQFKISYTRFEVSDLALVAEVGTTWYEPDITRLIIPIHVDSIHFESRVIPSFKRLYIP